MPETIPKITLTWVVQTIPKWLGCYWVYHIRMFYGSKKNVPHLDNYVQSSKFDFTRIFSGAAKLLTSSLLCVMGQL